MALASHLDYPPGEGLSLTEVKHEHQDQDQDLDQDLDLCLDQELAEILDDDELALYFEGKPLVSIPDEHEDQLKTQDLMPLSEDLSRIKDWAGASTRRSMSVSYQDGMSRITDLNESKGSRKNPVPGTSSGAKITQASSGQRRRKRRRGKKTIAKPKAVRTKNANEKQVKSKGTQRRKKRSHLRDDRGIQAFLDDVLSNKL